MNTKNGEEDYKRALNELKDVTNDIYRHPIPANEELRYYHEIFRNAVLRLPKSLENIVTYHTLNDEVLLDQAIEEQAQIGEEIDYAANQIFAW